MSSWIAVIEDEVRIKLRAMEVFIQDMEKRLITQSPDQITPMVAISCLGRRRR